jgi:integrase
MEEGLGRKLEQIDFAYATPRRRVPVVLSREECMRLFDKLEGTSRLLGELAYGSGLRNLELLRLRIQDVDLARGRLIVRAGKGDKDRVTVLSTKLIPPLASHIERLRGLYAEDRAQKIPGVWLPIGLARKYPHAGISWEWQWLFPSREISRDPATGRHPHGAGPARARERGDHPDLSACDAETRDWGAESAGLRRAGGGSEALGASRGQRSEGSRTGEC